MDTIVLILPREHYKVTDPARFKERFEPIDFTQYTARKYFVDKYKCVKKYIQNPPAEVRRKGTVYPNLAIYERLRGNSYTCDLHISISLPKLIYGHSFKDVYTEQMEEITKILVTRLSEMGVHTTKEHIQDSEINTLHYAINIPLPTEEQTRIFLDRMNKVSIGNWYEKNERHYANDGHAVRFHSSIFQIVFYMKYYDLFESASRSIDKRRTLQEVEIAKGLKAKGTIPPVIRLEIRMAGKRSITTHLQTVTGKKQASWLFKEVFDTSLSRTFLSYYWNKIIEDPINYNLLCSFDNADICRLVLEKHKAKPIDKILSGLGIFYMLHALGVKDVRELVMLRKSRASWYRERRKIATFINRYVVANSELIDTINTALARNSEQLELV